MLILLCLFRAILLAVGASRNVLSNRVKQQAALPMSIYLTSQSQLTKLEFRSSLAVSNLLAYFMPIPL